MDICALIAAYRPRLESFSFSGYPPAFAAFEGDAAPFFASLRAEDVPEQARSLIDGLAELRRGLPRRAASEQAEQDKRVLALFLAPAALRYGGAAEVFAGELSRQWNERFPRSRFCPGTYEAILKGFDANLLGLLLRKP